MNHLGQAIRNLAGNPNFARFTEALRDEREAAIAELCALENADSVNRMLTLVGEVRRMRNILDLIDEALGEGESRS